MVVRLPPLYALRTFMIAAHSASFARAAEELCVTPAAISRGIKSLEDCVGVRLFNRTHRRVELTAEGRRYFEELGDVFERMALATQNVTARQSHRALRVCAYPSFVMNWLIPRWCTYDNRAFDVYFLTTMSHDVNFEHGEIDAAVLSDRADYPGCRSDLLFTAHLIPVCSPALLGGGAPLQKIKDLDRVVMLHSDTRPNDWQYWLAANAAEVLTDEREGLRFESSNLMYEAAKAGVGVAIGIREVVQRDLATGSLVIPFGHARFAPCPYYLIYPDDREPHPALVPFRNWVIAEYHR
ncbi:MAG: LysR family transcriptional regulator [Azoarcus sp.]|uniref:LysR family transcriptional regulator n=2 Tax=Pseudazoarcus pumilus TaxID=2067960 RepID=A0A2I6S5C0_9RHOO|nr:LysR family transcriptional regulator [Pseudazoarcus pumilus]MBA4743608.1 LysR family transcriptional regulator [Azoarcus sp.]